MSYLILHACDVLTYYIDVTCNGLNISYSNTNHQYIKILVVCPCVTDVGVAVTNLRVVRKIITCVSAFTETRIRNGLFS